MFTLDAKQLKAYMLGSLPHPVSEASPLFDRRDLQLQQDKLIRVVMGHHELINSLHEEIATLTRSQSDLQKAIEALTRSKPRKHSKA